MSNIETQYLEVLERLLTAPFKGDRTGTGTHVLFGVQLRHNLENGFPLLTTKKVHFKSIAIELLWFLRGEGNTQFLKENGVTIWDEWANEAGNLGRVYGVQWRKYRQFLPIKNLYNHYMPFEFDQIQDVIDNIKKNPNSRRLVVSAWNVGELHDMALPPCHYSFQFVVIEDKLNICVSMRSCDFFLGACFNIASYSLLLIMIAQQTGYKAGEIVLNIADCHLYSNHVEQAKLQLSRTPYDLPRVQIEAQKDIDSYKWEHFHLLDYKSHPPIKAPIAI